jgi:glutamine synthetase
MRAFALDPTVDTVAVAVPDACGRLIGKRLTRLAWNAVLEAGEIPMPDFHLITDTANHPIPGLAVTGVHTGFRNGALRPDASSVRQLAWDEATALVLCDAHHPDGRPAEMAPRWILQRQVDRLAERGLEATAATELEFYAFRGDYGQLAEHGYRELRPAYHRAGDNDLLVDGHLEPLLGDIRRLMPASGIPVELSQGEGGRGQLEVSLHYAHPLEMADRHAVYKHGVKVIAHRHGLAATFMAKVHDDEAGSSCHVHIALTGADGSCAVTGPDGGLLPAGRHFLAGLLAYAPELCLLFAPYANSYRRLQPGSWAPATLTWGLDNRTTLVRLCGTARRRRFEFRLPGADANPYLALAGVLAAGLAGLECEMEPPPPVDGDGYAADAPALPRDLAEAVARFAASSVAAEAFGQEVRDHLAALGAHERDVARREVTDRDRARCFEIA